MAKNIELKLRKVGDYLKMEDDTIVTIPEYQRISLIVIKIPHKQKDNKYTNFFRNFKFFYEKAKELSDSQLNSFAKTLTDSCEIIEIKSWQVEQTITMFNFLNSDGLSLYDADIISAKLYAVAEKNSPSYGKSSLS